MPYKSPAGLIASAVILEVLSVIAVCLRVISRRLTKVGLAIDDYFTFAGLVFASGLSALQIYGASVKALGVPLNATIEDPTAVNGRLNTAKHIELSYLILGVWTVGVIKIAVVLLYNRVFGQSRPFRYVSYVWLFILAVWTLGFVLTGFLECGSHLLDLFGTPQAYLAHCGSAIPAGWGMVLSDVITDLITLLLPVPIVLRLHCTTGQKVQILTVFAVGLLSLTAGSAKAGYYIAATLRLYTSDAITLITSLCLWSVVEAHVGLMAACIVTFRPVFTRWFPNASLSRLITRRRERSTGATSSETYPADAPNAYSESEDSFKKVPSANVSIDKTTDIYLDDATLEAGLRRQLA